MNQIALLTSMGPDPRVFDAIFVAGEKDIERAVAQGVDRDRLTAIGYLKLDYLRRRPAGKRLFDNDRPIVFYIPHFNTSTSSVNIARDIILRLREQRRYNLIFAPTFAPSKIWPRPPASSACSFRFPGGLSGIWILSGSST